MIIYNEIKKLQAVRVFIENNSGNFNRTLSKIDSHTKEDIRGLRIRQMVLNNFDNKNKTKAFSEMIHRFKDYRLCQLFREILPYRTEYLQNQSLYMAVENHIDKYESLKEKHNVELLCFYILKYAYFIRNKYFHAEKLDPTFHLIKNDEIEELKFINEIFEVFLAELISSNSIF